MKLILYMIITPRVIKNPEEAARIFRGRKWEIDAIKEGSIKLHEKLPAEYIKEEEKDSEPKTQKSRIIEPR